MQSFAKHPTVQQLFLKAAMGQQEDSLNPSVETGT